MRFLIVGAGAIGGFVAGRLLAAGHDVTLLARGAHLRAMQTHGLRLEEAQGRVDYHGAVDTCANLRDAPEADIVIVTLKAYQLAELAIPLSLVADRAQLLVPVQNGVGWWYFQRHAGELQGRAVRSVDPQGALARSLPADRTIPAFAFKSAQLVEPGVVRHIDTLSDHFALGELDGSDSARLREFRAVLAHAGMKSKQGDPREWMWNKLLGNIFANPICAITRQTLGFIVRYPATRILAMELMQELAAVAAAMGCPISMAFEERLDRGVELVTARPSMLQDLEKKRPMELDAILGAVVELGQLVGVTVPRIETLLACLRVIDQPAHGHATQAASDGGN